MSTAVKESPVRRTLVGSLTALALAGALSSAALAEPDPAAPGTYPTTVGTAPSTAAGLAVAVGADADAELFDNLAKSYDAAVATGPRLLSFDAVNPQTGAVESGNIHVKPGCDIARPNGANAGLSAILKNQVSAASVSNPLAGDGSSPCIDVARSSRSKKTDGTEAGLTFHSLTRDAVTWATVGGSYAPDAPLTVKQVRGIFECSITDWAQVGGQYGAIHVYVPPVSAATYTFFLQSIGSTVANVSAGCGTTGARPTQQNDGSQLAGDPQGIAPYAVTKWAAQRNGAPGIADLRGGTVLGRVPLSDGTSVPPTVAYQGGPYLVLNPAFAGGSGTATSTQGRLLYDVVRNGSPLSSLFGPGGYVCQNQDTLLPPFGAVPLSTDSSQTEYCGRAS